MGEHTHETLRALAKKMVRITHDQFEGTDISPYKIDAHADTWKKQVEALERLVLELWDHPLMVDMQSIIARKSPPLVSRIGAVRAAPQEVDNG